MQFVYYLLIEIVDLQEEASSQIQLESSKSCAQGIAVFSHGNSPSTSWRRPQAIAYIVLGVLDALTNNSKRRFLMPGLVLGFLLVFGTCQDTLQVA